MMTTDWIRKHRDDLIDFVMELVATPSPNLPGDERAVAKAITAHLRRLDMDGFEIAAKEPHRPNVIYRLAGRGVAQRDQRLFAHRDGPLPRRELRVR